jgi:hypothetical protein
MGFQPDLVVAPSHGRERGESQARKANDHARESIDTV